MDVNLIIDQGNTATKLAYFKQDDLFEKKIFSKNQKQEIEKWISENIPLDTAVLVSSVTNDVLNLKHKNVINLNANTQLPIHNDYATPNTLGKDRIANAVAIWTKNKNGNSLCIDIGTCIKYDLVSDKGHYKGGNISPGMKMRYKALMEFTDQLPEVSPAYFEYGFGTTTDTSIKNGVQQAIFHEINGFIERYKMEFEQLTIFMTGGDINYFDKGFKNTIFADSDLTIFGLNEILKYNVAIKK